MHPPPLIGLDKVFLSITLTINYQVLASSSNLSNFFIWQCTHIETRFPQAARHIVRLERMGKGRKATYNAIGSCTLGKKLPCNSAQRVGGGGKKKSRMMVVATVGARVASSLLPTTPL